ncbi:McrC family protein [Vibrio sp. 10N.286.46.E10]|uniref:McrC family protein n=1 Tax=Vibrio sp. 10N.286.46.E10 TaxID=1884477 RepID=UPI000C85401A|nr:McrC family protein [Vibrio sp. 10N.286.46.E10]PMI23888.1 restriction endonuclease [Vibrio sp. 10N.286.46.E10]
MRTNKEISLFEFSYLVSESSDVGREVNHVEPIAHSAFVFLKQIALGSKEDNKLFRLCKKSGSEALQVRNHAGVIFTPDGTHIEVLPKVGRTSSNPTLARKSLLVMLRALKGFSHIQTSSALIHEEKMPLLEVFIGQFINSVLNLVKKGLKSDYVKTVDNLVYQKGKLVSAGQLRNNLVTKHKFYCEYQEYLVDRPANRLLHSALNIVAKLSRSPKHKKQLQELFFIFEEVPLSRYYKSDLSRLRLDRGMSHYHTPIAWATLILNGFSPQTMKGSNQAISLLFPMERVFEDYVAKVLRQQVPDDFVVKSQVKRKSLVEHKQASWFKLQPDLLLEKGGSVVSVLDTKWKLVDQTKDNGSDKYGLSQSDFYQMFAYGQHYFDDSSDEREMFLIYPAHDGFETAIEQSFDFNISGDNKLKLWIVPFVIEEGSTAGVVWPKECRLL